jgi:mono/diheme cytochrome c family protein
MNRILFPKLTFTIALLASLIMVNCGGKKKTDESAAASEPVATANASAEAGKAVYMGKGACWTCHGELGLGDGPAGAALNPKPRNLQEAEGWKNGKSLEGIMKTLMEGLAGGSMVSYKDSLTEEERMAVTEYVLSLGN